VIEIGKEIRQARLEHGLSQETVARGARTSRSTVGRIEQARLDGVSINQLARLLAVLGLELSARAYPAGQPVRDAAHLVLIDKLRRAVHQKVAWHFDVPLGLPGDQRAWDAVVSIGRAQLAVEAETRLHDIQAIQRRVGLKRRDCPNISAVVLLLAATRHNRNVFRAYREALLADFPVEPGEMLEALSAGRDPGGSGVLLL
jgi:transcriptional regulator with XRE-family HTH domain